MVIKAVIDLNYGDSGKGLMTDYFCHQAQLENRKCLNILTNGGAQRGHTVVHGNLRHVFHHFGSGTFSYADSYASKYFILNPMVYVQERKELCEILGFNPVLYVHPNCRVSTPYDMMFNKIMLEHTGKHNSCGMGVWNTIERYENKTCKSKIIAYHKFLFDNNSKELVKYLKDIRDYYSQKLIDLNIELSDEWAELFYSNEILEHYMSDLKEMYLSVLAITNKKLFFRGYDTLVFENAQGLLLDQDYDKENGTPSSTGYKYINEILSDFVTKDDDIEVCYVTRSYLTRHGDGDFPEECDKDEVISVNNIDNTNIYNSCQGNLRYGKLDDSPSLYYRIINDIKQFTCTVRGSLAVTHLDEKPFVHYLIPQYESYSPDSLLVKTIQHRQLTSI